MVTRSILDGEKGPRRDCVLINAALGLVAGGAAGGIAEGVKMAACSIDSGAALDKLQKLIDFTRRCAPLQAVVQ